MNRTCVSIDLEMTSARPDNQEIIEIAAIKFRGSSVLDSWSTLVNPRAEIPYNIRVLTGIEQADVDRAPLLSEVAGPLRAFLEDCPLVGQSVNLDLDCLTRKGIALSNSQLDTFELASILLPQLPEYSLAALAQFYGIKTDNQHRAAGDALATKELFLALWQQALGLDLGTIQEINRLARSTRWPPALFFRELEREKSHQAMGASIRDQLVAKGFGEFGLGQERTEGRALKPKERTVSIDVDAVAGLLEPGGVVSQKLPGYEHREEQVRVLRQVSQVFNEGGQLLVEAGTGVGKSMAYLLPAVHYATANRQHVIVSTNTLNLQDQLYGKDLPDLSRMLDLQLRVALVKGRANYLCRRRWATLRRQPTFNLDELSTLVKILVWLPTTSTGDVSELNLNEKQRMVWSRLHSTSESCLNRQCEHQRHHRCFVYRARERAEAAHIVITNHALLLSDAAAENRILPEYQHLIIDEAHHLEDEATDQFTFHASQREVLRYLDNLSGSAGVHRRTGLAGEVPAGLRGSKVAQSIQRDLNALVDQMSEEVERARNATRLFFEQVGRFLEQHAEESRGYDTCLRLKSGARSQSAWAQVDIAWGNLSVCLHAVQEVVSKIYTILLQLEDQGIGNWEDLLGELAAQIYYNQQLRDRVEALVSRPDANEVYWAATDQQSEEVSLHIAPLHVGELLNDSLFRDRHTLVLTSATLSTAGRFDYIRGRLGLPDATDLLVGSPFDYVRSTLLYLPEDIAEPERPYYQKHVQQAVTELCRATQGRTLCLFTSHSQLRQTWQAVRPALEEAGIQVLAQGIDGSARQLLRTFRANPRSVILGSASFWEGVDVVGDALSVLVIARLPFAVPTDPLIAARSETFDEPFSQYSVPQSILRFKQGFGRLIRSKADRGVVVVLDKRIQTKSYGSSFLRSLPTCTTRTGPLAGLASAAKDWLQQGAARDQNAGSLRLSSSRSSGL
ncbi:MAG: exonuclease domain-containing protein [Bacteroidetes bacterium]|nr:exonuclease domain-containing protein [Bacteroidota bacterium]MCL5027337.1 exonuclease domain-containing protein [Chloroflexota bacterium]